MLSNKHTQRIRKIFQFGTIWIVFGLIYTIIEKGFLGDSDHFRSTNNPYNFEKSLMINSTATFFMGVMQGLIEFYFLRKYFIKMSFRKKVVSKAIIYILIIILFVLCLNSVYNSNLLRVSLFSNEILSANLLFIHSFSFLSIVVFVASIIVVCLLFSEVSDYIGHNVLTNFFNGKYHRSQTEERVFMFLDMKSSTSIAEKLGHVKYYQLLNQYYADMTNPILESSGEIYQYAGDNIIISWTVNNGLNKNNCINCFFNIKKTITQQSAKYKESFGLMPEFKAAIHCGKVTTGEIGVVKKEIVFTGDVLNTTDRIQGLCNVYNVDLLISDLILAGIKINGLYQQKEIGLCQLKGKNERVKLFTLIENDN
jgi:adenylate cyclase